MFDINYYDINFVSQGNCFAQSFSHKMHFQSIFNGKFNLIDYLWSGVVNKGEFKDTKDSFVYFTIRSHDQKLYFKTDFYRGRMSELK